MDIYTTTWILSNKRDILQQNGNFHINIDNFTTLWMFSQENGYFPNEVYIFTIFCNVQYYNDNILKIIVYVKEHGKCLTSDPILMILHRVH